VDPGGRIAWVELSIDPTRPTKIHVGEQYSEMLNPTLDKLLAVIDELDHAAVTNANN
jgi:hypothetical protein